MEEKKKNKKKVICIAFEGVVSEPAENGIGDALDFAKEGIETLKQNGWTIVLVTDHDVEAVKKWLKGEDIPYDYINESPKDEAGADIPGADIYVGAHTMHFSGWKSMMYSVPAFQPYSKKKEDVKKEMEKTYKDELKWQKSQNMFK